MSYKFELSQVDWEKSNIKASPSRRLSGLFFLKLPWDKIESELGEIHVMDVGCGKGNMAILLQDFSGARIKSYTGLDIVAHSQWQEISTLNPWIHFRSSDSKEIRKHIPDATTLIVSQSALEHFENDLTFFREIRDFIDEKRTPALQIHLFPSPACLELFGLHGVRQYTPRSVSIIAKLFEKNSFSILFPLGGAASNRVHREYITRPLAATGIDLRDMRTAEYDRAVKSALLQDMTDNSHNPSFYALVIHSFHRNLIWN
jgi:SAM-dependent methyltransferase